MTRTPRIQSYSTTTGGETDQKVVNVIPTSRDSANFANPDAFAKLGNLFFIFLDFMKTRNNSHHAIKEQVCNIRMNYNRNGWESESNTTKTNGETREGNSDHTTNQFGGREAEKK